MPPLAGLKSSAARTTSPRRCTRCARQPRRMTTALASPTCCIGCRQFAPEWTPSVLPAVPTGDRLRLSAAVCCRSRQPCARSGGPATACLNDRPPVFTTRPGPARAPRRELCGRQPSVAERAPQQKPADDLENAHDGEPDPEQDREDVQ